MVRFPCPYLRGEVDLSEEREHHIAERHPDLLPAFHDLIGATLADPDQVRRSVRFGSARLFSRWCTDLNLKGLRDRPNATPRQKVVSEIFSGVEHVRIVNLTLDGLRPKS